MDAWLIWLIIAVLLLILELMTQMLWALCFAAGAVGALIASLCGASAVWQVIVMAVVGIVVYFTVFPWFRRFHNRQSAHAARTGMDALIGRRAIVTEKIRPGRSGRARIDGDNWQVVAPGSNEEIPAGTEVVVTGYDSIILTVNKINN